MSSPCSQSHEEQGEELEEAQGETLPCALGPTALSKLIPINN